LEQSSREQLDYQARAFQNNSKTMRG